MAGLGSFPGGLERSYAYGISADGKVVVGAAYGANGREAFRWTAETGMVPLGPLPGGGVADYAFATSADGSIIVGTVGLTPLIWDAVNGWRYLSQVLTNDLGLDLSGWNIQDVRAVSDDGLTVAGTGRNPLGIQEAWVANLGTNTPPFAVAGENQSVHVGDTVELNGGGSYDAETASEDLLYAWQLVQVPAGSGAVLTGADTVTPSFSADLLGDYTVSLVVTDEGGLSSGADEVHISSVNTIPNANAGPDQGVYVGALVTLDGSGSTDPDDDPLTYMWAMISQPDGSVAVLSDTDQVAPFFYPDLPGAYEIELIVNDGYADSAPDSVTVLVTSVDDYVCARTTEALNSVANLPDSSFTTKGNRTAFGNFLTQGCTDSQKGNTSQARHKLEQALERTDGCVLRGAPDTEAVAPLAKDYIINCPDQELIYPIITEALDALSP
jgi:probable HAF family extracellular repeat protein